MAVILKGRRAKLWHVLDERQRKAEKQWEKKAGRQKACVKRVGSVLSLSRAVMFERVGGGTVTVVRSGRGESE